jgi:hypothetical protein
VSIARPKKISEIKPLFGNLAQTSQYQVMFGGLSPNLMNYLDLRGVDQRFIMESAGLLCSSASLPGSAFATASITGNYTGVTEEFAHTRLFNQIDLTFYVDKEYKLLKFIEHWMEYISSGSNVGKSSPGYFYRMKYPNDEISGYKCDGTKILKFNRDYNEEIEFNFFGLFPKALFSPTVSYDESQTLTASASFMYTRYVSGRVNSIDISKSTDNNKESSIPNKNNKLTSVLNDEQILNIAKTASSLDVAIKDGTINLEAANALVSNPTAFENTFRI